MPPKTRASGRLSEKQNKKRKADEVEGDLSTKEEDRPKKKAKIGAKKEEEQKLKNSGRKINGKAGRISLLPDS